jgi:serine/threonine-protein kinase
MAEPALLDQYELGELLGCGSTGRVYASEDENGVRIALKVLHSDLAEDASLRDRFLAAAERAQVLEHDNVARVLTVADPTQTNHAPYYVMPRCAGRDLAKELGDHEFTTEASCEIGVQLCMAMLEAHDVGLRHLDLKPENVMLSWGRHGEPVVQVLDFGITTSVFGDDHAPRSLRWAQSAPRHQAPEVLMGTIANGSADVYSIGAILYELLAGAPLFTCEDEHGALSAAVCGVWRPLVEHNPHLQETLVRAVENALAPDPDERPASPLELMRQLLLHVSEDSPVFLHAKRYLSARPSSSPRADEPPNSPSLVMRRAPKPKQLSQMPNDRLLSPIFPKAPVAPRFSLAGALQVFDSTPMLSRLSSFSRAPRSDPSRSSAAEPITEPQGRRFDLLAIGAGLGLGVVLAWLKIAY